MSDHLLPLYRCLLYFEDFALRPFYTTQICLVPSLTYTRTAMKPMHRSV